MRTNNRFKTTIVKKGLSNILLNTEIITTPYEKVLSIIEQAKNFITINSKNQDKLIKNLEWCIKIITSHSLYSYELKEKEAISKMSQNNPEFRQLVDFVSEYNEKIIQMNRKYNYILSDKLLQKSSTKLNKRKIERKKSFGEKESHFSKLFNLDENRKNNKIFEEKSSKNNIYGEFDKIKTMQNTNLNYNITKKNNFNKYIKINNSNPFEDESVKKRISLKKGKNRLININDEKKINKTYTNNSIDKTSKKLNTDYIINNTTKTNSRKKSSKNSDHKSLVSFDQIYLNKKSKNIFPSIQKISITINKDNNFGKQITNYNHRKDPPKRFNTINSENISLTNPIVFSNYNSTENNSVNIKSQAKKVSSISKSRSKKNIPQIKEYSYIKFQNKLFHEGYDISKLITEKNFNIFELEELIGYNNVLPMVGKTILENLGLLDEDILNISKLDQFLTSVSNQYKQETLYHNSMHGSDVTQSVYIFFTHSNAEKIAKTNVLDLLSIIIAALGHDIAHPGLTNTFHINDSTEIAITYNDISILENFHASTLFKTLRKTDNNIFEKLTPIDYKIIRKRMISEILATDMANHGKVLTLINSKISTNENNEYKLNLLSGNEQTKNEEQQSLLDYMIHLADLAHNTKLFDISKKWVELLSEEFWRQGDLEKKLKLPVTFLCDREDVNIPKSQKGFISGYIVPTFECLVKIFPTLRYTLDNANHNLKEWQKLMEEGRKTGWTPEKEKSQKRNDINPNFSKSITNGKFLLSGFSSLNKNKEKKEFKKIYEQKIILKTNNNPHKKNEIKNNRNDINKNIINLSYYNNMKNKKMIAINKDDYVNLNHNATNNKTLNNSINKTTKSSPIKKSILKINKEKLSKQHKNKSIKFKTEENNEKNTNNNKLNDKKA